MKELIEKFESFVYKNGLEPGKVFDDLLRYIIHGYTLPGQPGLKDWNYNQEQNKEFYDMYALCVQIMEKELRTKEWFDIFGNIYENFVASKGRKSNNGQFFTPEGLCDLMSEITRGDEKISGKIIGDCACGSGRTLLSFHVKNPGNYYIAEDVDRTCAMMTVCNFLFHGVVGEVIWHDSINPDSFFGAWRVNEQLNKFGQKYFGIPHIQSITYEQTKLKKMWDKRIDIYRVLEKLKGNEERICKQLKNFDEYKSLSDKEKLEYKQIRDKYINIRKIIKKYEKLHC